VTEHGSTTAALVDVQRLTEWAQAALPGEGEVAVERLAEGHSNLTFVLHRDGREMIMRRPPLGPLLPTAHDVIREARVLSLLAGTGVRVPEVIAWCEDVEVIGAPFYVMQRVQGIVIREVLPDEYDVGAQRDLGLDLARALGELHLSPWEPFVEAGIGKPSGYLERQLRRWVGQREGIQAAVAAAGATARELPDYDAVRDWLRAGLPSEQSPAVVHGDYKLDNVIVSGSRIQAIVDWEMATVGDPRADLGYLLSLWPEEGETSPLTQLVAWGPGFPKRDELVEQWATTTGRDPGDTTWFTVLAVWKLAILLEASYHRWMAGMSDDPFFATLDVGVPALLARARELARA
jgi:aminoglycoside phosphotransferase (APT) family kinase protein